MTFKDLEMILKFTGTYEVVCMAKGKSQEKFTVEYLKFDSCENWYEIKDYEVVAIDTDRKIILISFRNTLRLSEFNLLRNSVSSIAKS